MPSDKEATTEGERGTDDGRADAGAESEAETGSASAPEPESEPDSESEPTSEPESEAEPASDSVTDVDTIVVDPEDVLQAVAYNGQEDIGLKAKTVFSLTPPFGDTVEPSLKHLEDDGGDDEEIHIRPFRFVAEGRQVIDQRPTSSLANEEMDADDPEDAAIEAWIDEALAEWKAHVRENLVDSVDIYSSHGMAFIDVEYREE
ncbi:hypothetical protein [Natronomonas sp.]|uniref:hypothetical protein n=1 Tax=Natronomonas sp. TaxID=2184060 RepID=UPI002603CBCB|nr:hypothetical protein [Natronomonas sp.]